MRSHARSLLLLFPLLTPIALADNTPPAVRIRQDLHETGQAFRKAGKDVGHEAVQAYHKNRGAFAKIGHSVRAQLPAARHELHEQGRKNRWLVDDYHHSVGWIRHSAHEAWHQMRRTWYQLTGSR